MLSVSEAQTAMMAAFRAVDIETVPLDQALGRVLAENLSARMDLPHFSSSTMDGFAVRSEDIRMAGLKSPVRLRVTHEIPAGVVVTDVLQPGCAARIMTGAPMIPGADTVVPVEDTNQFQVASSSAEVLIQRSYPPAAFIRPVGVEIHKGQVILQKGQKIQAQEIGMLASLGFERVGVYRRPKIAVVSSGDELIRPPEPLTTGKIYDSNSFAIAAQARQNGWDVLPLGVVKDQPDDLMERLDSAVSAGVDLIVSTAGVSVGAYDFVKEVVEKKGALSFWRVNIRPGKPVAFGTYRNTPFFGLPGNPVSAFVGFLIFVTPAVRKLSGLSTWNSVRYQAKLEEPLESDGRESYLRAIVQWRSGEFTARVIENQSSGYLYSLVEANTLLIVPSGVKSLPKDSQLDFLFLNNDELIIGG